MIILNRTLFSYHQWKNNVNVNFVGIIIWSIFTRDSLLMRFCVCNKASIKTSVSRHKAFVGTLVYHWVFPLQGTTFFDKLLEKLQQKYSFDVEDYMESSLASQENQSRHVKLAILSIQRLMINLGDIARYREQMNHSGKVNYGRARRWGLGTVYN